MKCYCKKDYRGHERIDLAYMRGEKIITQCPAVKGVSDKGLFIDRKLLKRFVKASKYTP